MGREYLKKSQKDWKTFFRRVFEYAKAEFKREFHEVRNGDSSPGVVALRDVIYSLPIPVKLIGYQVNKEDYTSVKDDLCYLIKYDFSRFGDGTIEDLGVEKYDSERFKNIVQEIVDQPTDEDFLNKVSRDLTDFGFWDAKSEYVVCFVPYDIQKREEDFCRDFHFLIRTTLWWSKFFNKIKFELDYNKHYQLPEDEILSLDKIIEGDGGIKTLRKSENGKSYPLMIEDLQKDIAKIQLIPPVPEDIKRIFDGAKKLYIYGYFAYYFFTIAQHYACLSLESAIKNRYWQEMGDTIVLSNNKGETVTLKSPSYSYVFNYCKRRKGWKLNEIKVNDQKFLSRIKEILDFLEEKDIITKRERKHCKLGLDTRNYLSHLTSIIIHMPSSSMLKFVADLINSMYIDKEIKASLLRQHRRSKGLRKAIE